MNKDLLDMKNAAHPTSFGPSVCCIVLNWNGWQDTVACLESLQKSDYCCLAVVVVDNGSTDNSVEMIRERHPWVEIFETHANLGFAGGNNHGIRLAVDRGFKYVWLLNNDTIVEAKTLAALVAVAEADPKLGEIGSVLFYADQPDQVQAWGGGTVSLWTGVTRHCLEAVTPEQLDYLTAASVLIPSEVFRKIGLLDEGYFMYWEDTDLSYRIRAAGWKLGIATSATLLHKESASSGRKSATLEGYVSASGVRFLSRFAPLPWVSILFFIFGRAARRFLILEWKRGCAVLAGLKGTRNARASITR